MSEKLVEQLIHDEGLRLKPYKDSVGKLTIGVGRNLDDVGISREEAMLLLNNDIAKATEAVRTHIPWANELDEARFGALVNMAFNLGIGGLLQFKNTLAHLKAGRYEDAAREMLKSKWAQQVGPRADRLSTQVKTGVWQIAS